MLSRPHENTTRRATACCSRARVAQILAPVEASLLPVCCLPLRVSCAARLCPACGTVYAVTCMVQLTLGTPAWLSANRYQNPGRATPGSLITDSVYVYVRLRPLTPICDGQRCRSAFDVTAANAR